MDNNIIDLAKSKLVRYITVFLYMIGFIFLVFEQTGWYVFIFIVCFILLIVKIVYEWKFIMKTLKGKKK